MLLFDDEEGTKEGAMGFKEAGGGKEGGGVGTGVGIGELKVAAGFVVGWEKAEVVVVEGAKGDEKAERPFVGAAAGKVREGGMEVRGGGCGFGAIVEAGLAKKVAVELREGVGGIGSTEATEYGALSMTC